MNQFSHYTPSNPPPAPRSAPLNMPPALQDFAPAISGGLVEYIERQANQSAIRDAAFSVLGVNYFDNPDYVNMLSDALLFAHFQAITTNQPYTYQVLLGGAISWFDPYWMSSLLQSNYHALSQQLDPRAVAELSAAGRNRDSILNDMDQFARSGGWEAGPNRGAPRGGQPPQGRYDPRAQNDFGPRPPRGGVDPRYASRGNTYGAPQGRPGTASAGYSGRPGQHRQQDQSQYQGRDRRAGGDVFQHGGTGNQQYADTNRGNDMYESRVRREPIDQMARAGRQDFDKDSYRDLRPRESAVIEEVGAREAPVNEPKQVDVACTQDDWRPSETQPYFEAFVKLRHDAIFSFNRNDEIIQGVTVKEQDHVIPGSPEALALEEQRRAEERLQQANAEVTLGEKAIATDDEGKPSRPEAVVRTGVALEDSLEGAWTSAYIGRLQSSPGWKLPMIYRQEVDVAQIFVERRAYNDVIEEILKCEGFESAARRLLAARGALPRRIWKALDSVLTKMTNNMLAINLGMGFDKEDEGYTSIDSFCEDASPLDTHISTVFNQQMLSGYRDNQHRELHKLLCKLSDAEIEGYRNSQIGNMEGFPEDVRPELTFIASRYTLTLLDTDFDELGVQFGPSGSSMLSGHLTPLLESMAAELFTVYPEKDISRHLLRTKDGRTFEFVRGYLVKGSYLLTEITCQC